MTSNTSRIGTIGELAITSHLLNLGWDVFKEVTGSAEIDLVALKNGRFIRVQVKCQKLSRNGAVVFKRALGGKEKFVGTEFDVYAIYVPEKNLACFISMSELTQNGLTFSVRVIPAQNGAKKNIRIFTEFDSFERAVNAIVVQG